MCHELWYRREVIKTLSYYYSARHCALPSLGFGPRRPQESSLVRYRGVDSSRAGRGQFHSLNGTNRFSRGRTGQTLAFGTIEIAIIFYPFTSDNHA